MRNAGLEEAQAGIKIAGRNINNLRYADDTTLRAESEEELKSLLMKVYFSDKIEAYVTGEYLRKRLVLVIKGEMGSTGGVDCDFQLDDT